MTFRSRSEPRVRRGTVLLLCIVIMTTLAVLAAGFVKVMQLHRANGQDDARWLLARETALMGRNHAIEQIVRGYVEEPMTRQDGPAFATFQALTRPYQVDDLDVPASRLDLDGRSASDPNFTDVMCYWEGGDFKAWAFADGWTMCDGRGRYVEPEFYNRAGGYLTAAGAFAASQPSVPVRFGDHAAALPDRHHPLLLDDRLQRVEGDPLQARDTARYRLRYAVDVVDLDGEMLLNPDPAIQPDRIVDADPAALPRTPITLAAGEAPAPDDRDLVSASYARIVRAAHAVFNLRFVWSNFGNQEPNETGQGSFARAEHVFLGRGQSNNFDQRLPFDRRPVPDDYAPVTFPLMYRGQGNVGIFKTTRTDDSSRVADRLLANGAVVGLPAGGEVLPTGAYMNPPTHALTGPQYSFRNADTAVLSQFNEGVYDYGTMSWGSFTPFGRGLTLRNASAYKEHPAARYDRPYQRYAGDVDVPWCVNPLTAPPRVISAMVTGYMPPGVVQRDYHYASDARGIGGDFSSYVIGFHDLFVPQISQAFARYLAPARTVLANGQIIAPDYHVPCERSTDNGSFPTAAPTEDRAGYRKPSDRYPGPIVYDGFLPGAGGALVHDDLGHYLRYKAAWTDPDSHQVVRDFRLAPPRDPITALPLWLERAWGGRFQEIVWNPTGVGGGQPLDWQKHDLVTVRPHPDSLWAAMGQAMCAAIAVARAQWLQFPSAKCDPATLFAQAPDVAPTWGPWPGATRVRTVADLDALFLANLGIDIANPSSLAAVPVWGAARWGNPDDPHGTIKFYSYTPDYTVASLAHADLFIGNSPTLPGGGANPAYDPSLPTYTSAQRAAAMELMINDFRLSLLGSSPGYLDRFQALDLDGDGKARCSGFAPNPSATPLEAELHLDQFGAPGDALAHHFSTTGCFTIGKSKFYRILSRGEVWDNFIKAPVSTSLLDSVICVDPADEARELANPADRHPGRQYSTHLLYQRAWSDKYRGDLVRTR